jgi:2-methylisocitrate lyase-like PEP mutase family enzyme
MAATFRELFDRGTMIETVNLQDAQQAALAQDVGFEAVAVGGSLISTHLYAMPDGWITPEEIIQQVRAVRAVSDVAILVDLDDAGGTPETVYRYVQAAEAAGAGAVLIEDVDCPSRFQWNDETGQWDYCWPRLRPMGAAADLLTVARSAMRDPATLLIGRSDALVTAGFDEAIRRAHAYIDTGVIDAILLPYLPDDRIAEVGKELGVPIMNGSPTPTTREEREVLINTGMRIVFYSGPSADMYRASVDYFRSVGSVMTDKKARDFPVMKEWIASRVPEPIRARLGNGPLAQRVGWGRLPD